MLTLSTLFTAWPSSPPPHPKIQSACSFLATSLLPRRLPSIYAHLSSQQRNRCSATLLLLSSIVSTGPFHTSEFVRTFDFSLPSLSLLSRPRPTSKPQQQHRERNPNDDQRTVQTPTRVAFTTLLTALLRTADAQTLQEVVRIKPILGNILAHLSTDPVHTQVEILKLIRKRVLSISSLGDVFTESILGQFAIILARTEGAEEGGEEDGEEGAQKELKQQCHQLVFSILLSLCTDPVFGVVRGNSNTTTNNKRLLRFLQQKIKPSESAAHGELFRAAISHSNKNNNNNNNNSVAEILLASFPFAMEPTSAGKWVVHASLLCALIRAVFLPSAPTPTDTDIDVALKCIFPSCLTRSSLSRGVQHSNGLVRHATLCLLSHMLMALERVVQGRTGESSLDEKIVRTAKTRLPDIQSIIAQLTRSLVVGGGGVEGSKESISIPGGGGGEEGDEPLLVAMVVDGADDNDNDDDQEEKGGSDVTNIKQMNTALLSAALHVLTVWRRCLPSSFSESTIDVDRLLPGGGGSGGDQEDFFATSLPPLHQLQFIHLLLAASESKRTVHTAHSGISPALLSILHLIARYNNSSSSTTTAGEEELVNAAIIWASNSIYSTGVMATAAEGRLWVEGVRSSASAQSVCVFLHDAIALVLRRPSDFFEYFVGQGQGARNKGGSLLALAALRQLIRVLASDKKSKEDKSSIAWYVARSIATVLMVEEHPRGVGEALHRVLLSESLRMGRSEDGGSTKKHKRKTESFEIEQLLLTLEKSGDGDNFVAPLRSLVAFLHSVVAHDNDNDSKVAKGKKRNVKDGGVESLVALFS